MNKSLVFVLIKLLLASAFLLPEAFAQNTPTPKLVVSFSILQDIVQNLVPPNFKVQSLVAAGQDSHGYQATPKDFLALKKADHILLVGHQFEPWAEKAVEKMRAKNKTYYVTTNLSLLPLVEDDHHHSEHDKDEKITSKWDPHFWQSPEFSIQVIENLSTFLQTAYPSSKDEIKKRTSDYLNKLKDLQSLYKKEFEKVPESSKKMVLAHNSFQYFAKEFAVQVESPLDAAQEGESSIQKVSSLIQKIKQEKIKSLFLEKSSPAKLIKSISKETKVPIAGTLYSDCLSKEDLASTYLKLLETNFSLILKSMKGQKP